jgi:hypothetical protein
MDQGANKVNTTSADRTRELLARMFPAERPLTELQRAHAALSLALEERARLPRNSAFLTAARERVTRCRAEVKRLTKRPPGIDPGAVEVSIEDAK